MLAVCSATALRTKTRASSLVGRLRHVKDDLDLERKTFEHKLRDLIWLY